MVGCYASSALFSIYQYPWLLLLPVKQKFFQHVLISDIGLSSTMATFSLSLKSLATSLASLEQSSQMDK